VNEQHEEYEDYEQDAHAKARDRKVSRRSIDKMMRGNRSVFTIKEAKQRRDKRLVEGD
jgi:hypothetical protein